MDDGMLKRPCLTSPLHFEDEDDILAEPSSSHMRWAGSTMLHPSILYQHVQHEESLHQVMLGRPPRLSFRQNSCSYTESEGVLYAKKPFLHQSLSNRQGPRKEYLQSTKKDTPSEENLSVALTEEDFLSMVWQNDHNFLFSISILAFFLFNFSLQIF